MCSDPSANPTCPSQPVALAGIDGIRSAVSNQLHPLIRTLYRALTDSIAKASFRIWKRLLFRNDYNSSGMSSKTRSKPGLKKETVEIAPMRAYMQFQLYYDL